MVGQLKNAKMKFQKVHDGSLKVSEEELQELEAKQQFWVEYCSLGSLGHFLFRCLQHTSNRTCERKPAEKIHPRASRV